MNIKKKLENYETIYKEIPENTFERFIILIKTLNIKTKELVSLKENILRIKNIKYETINFIFYFIPEATPRPRYSRFSKVFYVKNAHDYNSIFKEIIESCEDINFKISTPCELLIKTYFPIPKGMTKIEKILSELELIPNISKPDWDNCGKTYSDMIQKHLLIDDSLVYDGRVLKHYSSKPRIEISIRFMTDYESNYTRNKIQKWGSYTE